MRLFEGERGVSDVLAFIIVFSIIITSVALVYGTGFSSLDDVREGEQKANAERAMEALALSMNDIVAGETPRRGGSLNLGGGLLQVDESPTVSVTVEDSTDTDVYSYSNDTGTFAYTVGTTTVAYENGGVFRSDRDASVNVRRASMTCTDDRAIVSLVLVRTDSGAIDSEGDVEITMAKQNSTVLYRDVNGANENDVTVEIDDTQFAVGWESYLNGASEYKWSATQSGDTVTADCEDTDRVIVRVTVIDVTFGNP